MDVAGRTSGPFDVSFGCRAPRDLDRMERARQLYGGMGLSSVGECDADLHLVLRLATV